MDIYTKQPADVELIIADFTDYLALRSDTISTRSVSADTGLTVDSSTIVGTTVKALVSGGTAGSRYNVCIKITTAGGLTKEHDVLVVVRQIGRASS